MFGFMAKMHKGQNLRQEEPRPGHALSGARIVEIMKYFPIGGKIRYYPEFRKDVVLESIIIAYGINQYLVYSQNDIHIQQQPDGEPAFLLDDDWQDVPVREINSFCFVLPEIGDMEKALDYASRVAMVKGGWFMRGERFTLMSLFANKGVPHVDAEMRKRVLLKEGYYANHSVFVLEVLPDSLTHIDQRQQHRLSTRIPLSLYLTEDSKPYDCLLVDFSECSFKIQTDHHPILLSLLEKKKTLIVSLDLPVQMRTFILKGRILRRADDHVVISIVSRLVEGQFEHLDLLGAIDLKASLLQHPETR